MSVINALTPEQKYSKDGPFNDPVVRCDACQAMLFVAELHQHGMCGNCGNTRVRNVRTMSGEEMTQAKAWVEAGKLDGDWLKLFEALQ
jgi:predicted RNA-binding Zn-ribbon protein involved in translation (DUF1610 family)